MFKEKFPDKTPIKEWFYDVPQIKLEELGKQYLITDYGINDDGNIYTKKCKFL